MAVRPTGKVGRCSVDFSRVEERPEASAQRRGLDGGITRQTQSLSLLGARLNGKERCLGCLNPGTLSTPFSGCVQDNVYVVKREPPRGSRDKKYN